MSSRAARFVVISLVSVLATDALAQPPDREYPDPYPPVDQGRPPPLPPEEPRRPGIEWSSWIRLGYGTETIPPASLAAGVGVPETAERDQAPLWDAALGADVTVSIGSGGDLRLGAWAETRTTSAAVVGGEILIGAAPAKLDMFWYKGEGALILRAGGNDEVITGAVSYGYRAPWALFSPARGSTRYMIGVRMVVSATRSREDPRDWLATVGLEVEPIGAFRYVFGVRSWY